MRGSSAAWPACRCQKGLATRASTVSRESSRPALQRESRMCHRMVMSGVTSAHLARGVPQARFRRLGVLQVGTLLSLEPPPRAQFAPKASFAPATAPPSRGQPSQACAQLATSAPRVPRLVQGHLALLGRTGTPPAVLHWTTAVHAPLAVFALGLATSFPLEPAVQAFTAMAHLQWRMPATAQGARVSPASTVQRVVFPPSHARRGRFALVRNAPARPLTGPVLAATTARVVHGPPRPRAKSSALVWV